jgi:hypothetical protein
LSLLGRIDRYALALLLVEPEFFHGRLDRGLLIYGLDEAKVLHPPAANQIHTPAFHIWVHWCGRRFRRFAVMSLDDPLAFLQADIAVGELRYSRHVHGSAEIQVSDTAEHLGARAVVHHDFVFEALKSHAALWQERQPAASQARRWSLTTGGIAGEFDAGYSRMRLMIAGGCASTIARARAPDHVERQREGERDAGSCTRFPVSLATTPSNSGASRKTAKKLD